MKKLKPKFNKLLFVFGIGVGIFSSLIVAGLALPFYQPKPIVKTDTKIIEVPHFIEKKVIVRVPIKLTFNDKQQIRCMADNAYYEARGEVRRGIIAVSNVVMNRTKEKEKFGSTPCSVIKKKYNGSCAFTWVCDDTIVEEKNPQVYDAVYKITQDVYLRNVGDVTGGATYFHSAKVKRPWDGVRRVKIIGNQVFYRQA